MQRGWGSKRQRSEDRKRERQGQVDSRVHPEFPTGAGREPVERDLLIRYQTYCDGLDFRSDFEYNLALGQAARYAHQLQLTTITVVFFVEAVDDANRSLYETPYQDAATGVMVEPVLVTTVE